MDSSERSAATTAPRWRLLWNRLQAKLHHAYPCRKCGYAENAYRIKEVAVA